MATFSKEKLLVIYVTRPHPVVAEIKKSKKLQPFQERCNAFVLVPFIFFSLIYFSLKSKLLP